MLRICSFFHALYECKGNRGFGLIRSIYRWQEYPPTERMLAASAQCLLLGALGSLPQMD